MDHQFIFRHFPFDSADKWNPMYILQNPRTKDKTLGQCQQNSDGYFGRALEYLLIEEGKEVPHHY